MSDRKAWLALGGVTLVLIAVCAIIGVLAPRISSTGSFALGIPLGSVDIITEVTQHPSCPPNMHCPVAAVNKPGVFLVIWTQTTTRNKNGISITGRKLFETQLR